jgi:hypothetical protein
MLQITACALQQSTAVGTARDSMTHRSRVLLTLYLYALLTLTYTLTVLLYTLLNTHTATIFKTESPVILDVRGPGLMVGLEFAAPQGSGVANKISKACLSKGMLLLTTSAFETVRTCMIHCLLMYSSVLMC